MEGTAKGVARIDVRPETGQRRVVRVGEDADLRVGEQKAADEVVLDVALDRLAEWTLDQTIPRRLLRRGFERREPLRARP